jgi:hypothetical protein
MKRARRWLLSIGIAVVPVVGLALLVPEPDEVSTVIRPGEFKPSLVTAAIMAWLYIGTAILFLMGLDIFKEKLRQAYRLICAGLVLLGIGLVQLPLLVATGHFDSAWIEYGGLSLPALVAWILIYAGVRSFAKAVGDTSAWTSVPLTWFFIIILTAAAGWFANDLPDKQFSSVAFAGNTANYLIGLVSAVLVLRIKHMAGPAYTAALTWFALSIVVSAFGIFLIQIYEVLGTQGGVMAGVPFVLSSALFLKAGYAFNKIREY